MIQSNEAWDTRYEWRAVALLSIGFGLVGLDRFMILPLFPVIMKDLGLDYQDMGNVAGVLALAWGVAAMFCGRLADRIGHRKILIPATVVFSLLAGCSGLATGLVSLLVIRAAMGVSEGAFTPASIVATLEASKPSRHGLNLGIQQNAVALFGLGLAPIIVTQLLLVVPSWRWVFMLVCLPGLLVAYLMYRVLRDNGASQAARHTQDRDASPHKWREVFGYRNVLLNIGGMFCWLTTLTVLSALLPSYLTDHLHLGIEQMGFVMSAIGFGGSLMTTASGLVVGVGEVFGGGIAPALGGYVAKHFGIENIVPLAAGGMALGIVIALALKETAPIKQRALPLSVPGASRLKPGNT